MRAEQQVALREVRLHRTDPWRAVVAEGAETVDQLEQLGAIGCDLVQGYVITRPLPVHELDAWFEQAERTGAYRVAPLSRSLPLAI